MSKLTIAGHPVHPQLVAFPIGALAFSWSMDGAYAMTGRRSFREAAWYSQICGLASAGLAAVAGAADYLEIPSQTHEKRIANAHALMNFAIVGLFSVGLLLKRKRSISPLASFAISTLGLSGLTVSAWYGGDLVYSHGLRVRRSHLLPGKEYRLPGDDSLVRTLDNVADRLIPAVGPSMRP